MLDPIELANGHVELAPLTIDDVPELEEALGDGELTQLFYTGTSTVGGAAALVDQALEHREQGWRQPFAVREAGTGRVLGSTSLYDPVEDVPRVAIGYTWYTAAARRTAVNTATKHLLLSHAFDGLACATVQFHTDRFNLRSQQAIERLGATKEGVLRSHQRRPDGVLRDTVCYSILLAEWPDVRRLLELRLARPRA